MAWKILWIIRFLIAYFLLFILFDTESLNAFLATRPPKTSARSENWSYLKLRFSLHFAHVSYPVWSLSCWDLQWSCSCRTFLYLKGRCLLMLQDSLSLMQTFWSAWLPSLCWVLNQRRSKIPLRECFKPSDHSNARHWEYGEHRTSCPACEAEVTLRQRYVS